MSINIVLTGHTYLLVYDFRLQGHELQRSKII